MRTEFKLIIGIGILVSTFIATAYMVTPLVANPEHLWGILLLGLGGLLYPFAKASQAIHSVSTTRFLVGCLLIGIAAGIGSPIGTKLIF